MVLQAIKYERGSLKLLDQRRLPLEETWVSVDSVQTAWSAIKDMVVRGAPAIAIAAALALAAQLVASEAGLQISSAKEAAKHVKEELKYLVTRWGFVKWSICRSRLLACVLRQRRKVCYSLSHLPCLLQPPNCRESIRRRA